MKNRSPKETSAIIFYDGHCGLCHRSVRFVLKNDSRVLFRFAPLQGRIFEQAFDPAIRQSLPDSIVLQTKEGSLLVYSSAVVYILKQLGGIWKIWGILLSVVPAFLRDGAYRVIAGLRRKLFRRPEGLCPLIPPHLRNRFLLDD